MITPVRSIGAIPARLPQRPQERAGVSPRQGRRMLCHCCGAEMCTAKPQDPMRDDSYGTCEGCRDLVARGWERDGFAGLRLTYTQAITRLTRYA